MNTDQLNMVPARDTVQTAYAALSGAQEAPPAQQVMGYAVLFYEVCQALQLDPSEMLDKARRLHRIAQDHYSVELGALQTYMKKELAQ
jgi:hypothetical protein